MQPGTILHAHRAVLVTAGACLAAGACLVLSACGGATVSNATAGGTGSRAVSPAAAGGSTAADGGAVKLTGNFCTDARSTMRRLPSTPDDAQQTPAKIRAGLLKVMGAGASGFTALGPEAPGQLRTAMQAIVSVYKSDTQLIANSGSLAKINQSLLKANATGSGGRAFRRVLGYIAAHCHRHTANSTASNTHHPRT